MNKNPFYFSQISFNIIHHLIIAQMIQEIHLLFPIHPQNACSFLLLSIYLYPLKFMFETPQVSWIPKFQYN
jgi:hypothetical protein